MTRCDKFFGALVLLGTLFRLWYIAAGPMDLSPDEAYYWDWSRHPAFGYYSKPPMIAWVIALSTRIGGSTPFFVRLPAVLLGIGTLTAGFLWVRRLTGDPRQAFAYAVLVHCVPLLSGGSVLMTIDAPLYFFWVLALVSTYMAVQRQRLAWWLAAGMAFGGGLLCKYTMLFYLLTLFGYLACSRSNRRLLLTPGPLLAVLAGFAILSPNLVWCAERGWVTAQHVMEDGGLHESLTVNPMKFLEYLGLQIGVLSPLIAAGAAYALYRTIRQRDDESLFFAWGAIPVYLFYAVLSFHKGVQANWPAVGTFTLLVATVLVWHRISGQASARPYHVRKWIAAALILGMAFSLLGFFDDALGVIAVPVRRLPSGRLKGWRDLGQQASAAARPLGNDFFALSNDRKISAELAFYMDGHPAAYCVPGRGVRNQYDLWGGFETRLGGNALYVGKELDRVARAFQRVEFRSITRKTVWGTPIGTYTLALCYGFKGWK